MFDIHKVKPVHGWREFIGEVGIIVLGVLIALLAESIIESWRWHEQTEQTRKAIKSDLLYASVNALERLAINPCQRSIIGELYNRLTSATGDYTGRPLSTWKPTGDFPVVPYVYSLPSRPYVFDSWKNAVSGGVFNHLGSDERQAYAELAVSIDYLQRAQESEEDASTRLAPLGTNIMLDPQTKANLIATLAVVDRQNRDTTIYAQFLINVIHSMHFNLSKKKVDEAVRNMFEGEPSHRGSCVRDLRLNLG